jgi:antitoxin (DNA-binding transcriptional repressor) of toxin-antitoxin stability system
LKELIDKLARGEEVIITENQQRVARLVGERPARLPRPAPGLGKGSILYMAPDFDDPLDEFSPTAVVTRIVLARNSREGKTCQDDQRRSRSTAGQTK